MDPRAVTIAVVTASVLGAAVAIWMFARSRIRYVVGENSFRVMLGGLTLRRIELGDIRRISTPHRDPDWSESENWRNTFQDTHRLLVIQRKSGRFRKFVVTPRLRYQLREQLRTAIAKADGTGVEIDEDAVER